MTLLHTPWLVILHYLCVDMQYASSWLMNRCHTNIYTSIYTFANTSTKVYKHHRHPYIHRTTVLSDTNQLTK